jgi:hypothetical protein
MSIWPDATGSLAVFSGPNGWLRHSLSPWTEPGLHQGWSGRAHTVVQTFSFWPWTADLPVAASRQVSGVQRTPNQCRRHGSS